MVQKNNKPGHLTLISILNDPTSGVTRRSIERDYRCRICHALVGRAGRKPALTHGPHTTPTVYVPDHNVILCHGPDAHRIDTWQDLITAQWADRLEHINRDMAARVLKALPHLDKRVKTIARPSEASEALYGAKDFEGFD